MKLKEQVGKKIFEKAVKMELQEREVLKEYFFNRQVFPHHKKSCPALHVLMRIAEPQLKAATLVKKNGLQLKAIFL